VIADLTGGNHGAYWEAGFAHGLGKPVVYTCEKQWFEANQTHFDTSHHYTVLWDLADLSAAGRDLRTVIRATLPRDAKQED
jgi:nucleoside 2-deoxyribosyltransferase